MAQSGRPTHSPSWSRHGELRAVDLAVETLPNVGDGTFRLIVFTDPAAGAGRDAAARDDRPGDGDEAYQQMEQELHETRERLQTAVEEYETSVEKLKVEQRGDAVGQ